MRREEVSMNEFRTPERRRPESAISIGSIVKVLLETPTEKELAVIQVVGPDDSGNTGEAMWAAPTNQPLGEELLGRRAREIVRFTNKHGVRGRAIILDIY